MQNSTLDSTIQQKIDQLAQEISEEMLKQLPPDNISPPSQKTAIAKQEIRDAMTLFFEKLQMSLQHLNQILPTIDTAESGLSLDLLWEAFDKAAALAATGRFPKDFCRLSDDQMASFNSAAARYYEGSDYPKAASVYLLLTFLDPRQFAFWQGLGNSEYFNGNDLSALRAYQKVLELNPSDIATYLYCANCHRRLKNQDKAVLCINQALATVEANRDLQQWKKPAEELKLFLIKAA